MESNFVGRYCMVRTYSAGVFAGTIKEFSDSTVILTNARRIWYWEGAASLSQLATQGTSKPQNCKFPVSVTEIYLPNVIEVIPITDAAKLSIEGVPVWSK